MTRQEAPMPEQTDTQGTTAIERRDRRLLDEYQRLLTAPKPGADEQASWSCTVTGPVRRGDLPHGADFPMREAVRTAFLAVTGVDETRLSSGWGRPTPALDVEGLINDLYDAIFAIPIREVDPDTGKVTPADPEEVRDAALGAVILARLAARATEGGTDR